MRNWAAAILLAARKNGAVASVAVAIAVTIVGLLAGSGCSDDFGTPCELPRSPEIVELCSPQQDEQGNRSQATCIDPINPDCQSRLCVQFEGSDPFCSERCEDDAQCPSNATCESTTASNLGICVPVGVTR